MTEEEMIDKIEGLRSDLENAIEVAFLRGARYWVRSNYPEHYKKLCARFPDTLLPRKRIKHLKRGSAYEVIGDVPFQVSTGNQTIAGKQVRMIKDGDPVRVYRDEVSRKFYVRFPDEFTPDRFVDITEEKD